MSISLSSNKKTREIKLQFGKAFHLMNIIHAEIFPGNNPGFFNDALGKTRLKKWYDRRQKINFVHNATIIAMFTLTGTAMITDDPSSLFGWIILAIGVGLAAFEVWEQAYSKHESDKTIEKLLEENEKRKIENQELKREMDLLKKKLQ